MTCTSRFRIIRSDLDERPTVGLGYYSKDQAERALIDFRTYYSDDGQIFELIESTPEQQHRVVEALTGSRP